VSADEIIIETLKVWQGLQGPGTRWETHQRTKFVGTVLFNTSLMIAQKHEPFAFHESGRSSPL